MLMAAHGPVWRVTRPLREGATAGWMRLYYDHLYELCFHARDIEDVAKIAIRDAYATFRAEIVAVAVLEGDAWNVLPWRQNDTVAEPLRIPVQSDPNGPLYEPGTIVEIPDLPAFAAVFPALRPVAARGIHSIVVAAFGSRVHGRGYLSFSSTGDQHYSDDELNLMCLHALALGLGLDRIGAAAV